MNKPGSEQTPRVRRSPAILANTAVLLVLAGCTDDSATSTPATYPHSIGRALPPPGPVDPAFYESDGGYFFQTADRGIACGILHEAVGPARHSAGCQGETVPPPEMAACWGSDPAAATLAVGAQADYLCVNQGLFVGPPVEPDTGADGGPVLPVGASLSAHGFTCRAEPVGVSCRNDATGRGFEIAPGGNRLF